MPKKIKKPKGPKQKFEDRHARDLDGLQEKCYQGLHRPMVVKVGTFNEKIWYVCEECLNKYMAEHPEIKELVVGFKR